MPPETEKKDESEEVGQEAQKAFWKFVSKKLPPRVKRPVLIIFGFCITVTGLVATISAIGKYWDYISSFPGLVSNKFSLSCPNHKTCPFQGIRASIDSHCGISGRFSNHAQRAENEAKNNFCVSTANAMSVTVQDFLDLQKKTTNMLNSPSSRDDPERIGEGTYVSYVAFIDYAGYSDADKGEAANCNIAGNENNDINIFLRESADKGQSTTVTAEMSPHFRLPSWTPENIRDPLVQGYPVRVKGRLFFDGNCKEHCSSLRWEIHPVYSLDVCKLHDLVKCRESTDSNDWRSLSQVFSTERE